MSCVAPRLQCTRGGQSDRNDALLVSFAQDPQGAVSVVNIIGVQTTQLRYADCRTVEDFEHRVIPDGTRGSVMPGSEFQDLARLSLIENRGHPHTHSRAHESMSRVVLTHVLRTAPRRECASRGGPARNRGTRQAVLRGVGQPGAQRR